MPFSWLVRTPLRRLALHIALVWFAASLGGCAQQGPVQAESKEDSIAAAQVQTPYQRGLAGYRDNRFNQALANLNLAIKGSDLSSEEQINAHKHLGFIHCISNRETQCREAFQAILEFAPEFDLAPNEAGHPLWGPVWRSVKGALEERRAIARGQEMFANSAQQKLTEGIKAYDAGRFHESSHILYAALKSGQLERPDEIRAHKYMAFSYCLTKQRQQCQIKFRTILALDPSFELLPSEAGHPAWKTAYRKELAAARRSGTNALTKK
jgi:tetratricopeptide (TPR) repeat protein